MIQMTYDELKGYTGRAGLIEALTDEISSLYGSLPSGGGGSGGSTTPGDPTAAKVARITSLKAKVSELQKRQVLCEMFVDSIRDSQLNTIMRCKYILGYSWNKTARIVGYKMTGDSCRMLVKRYFKNKRKAENEMQ